MKHNILNNIIPTQGFPYKVGKTLDYEAIAMWCALGFFLEKDTFWKDVKWNHLNFDQQPWSYQPVNRSFDKVLSEFAELFEGIIAEQVEGKSVILPLSGGLDSRTLAVALNRLGVRPFTYSYRFTGGFQETQYGKTIAETLNWPFKAYDIPIGYLWDKIKYASNLNLCYSEFTHARQVAVTNELSEFGNLWLLGHWGDVLFDDMGVPSDLSFEYQLQILNKKIIKKGGVELAKALWQAWELPGEFETVLQDRIQQMHNRIQIKNANARIRAFKSLHWATRWTATNLVYFKHHHPIALPYFDDRICQFIMTVPEKFLAGRQIQIEYIKRYCSKLGRIPWQDKAPYNLFDYHKHLSWQHLPYRLYNKTQRIWKKHVQGKPLIRRNWEIQFLGSNNGENLHKVLFENTAFKKLVPQEITKQFYDKFQKDDQIYWSHPLSMLVTLSAFTNNHPDLGPLPDSITQIVK